MYIKIVPEKIYLSKDEYYVDLLENSISESFGDSIESVINKISDKGKAIVKFIQNFNRENNRSKKKKLAKIILLLFISLYAGNKYVQHISGNQKESIIEKITNSAEISVEKLAHYVKEILGQTDEKIEPKVEEDIFKPAYSFTVSETAKDTIKKYEKLKLKGYKIKGDRKITIGWGHAEPIRKSKYKVGQVITKEHADDLFRLDIKHAEDGVKRIFKEWEEQGNPIEITQGMYDAMVSIAFNAGITGLRTSKFIQLVKAKKFKEAADAIITVRNTGKFRGLDVRREAEKQLYNM